MTRLNRTDLTIAQRVQCAAQAFAQQAFGTITRLSEEFGLSRPTIYEAAASAEAVLTRHFACCDVSATTLVVDEAQLQRAIVALRVMAPNSIRAIEDLIPVLYPGVSLSYGKVQGIITQAQTQAQQFNAQADLSSIRAAALDELFSQGSPVLAGIDLDSGYLLGLAQYADRSGESWTEVLSQAHTQGASLEVVVKDAALGIAAGVAAVFPKAEQRDDCFHAHYEMNKVRQRLDRTAYAAIEYEETLLKKLRHTRAKHQKKRRQLTHRYVWAKRKSAQAIATADHFSNAVVQVQAAMSWVDLNTNTIRSGEQVSAEVIAAATLMRTIDRADCRKVATYLTNRAPGLACYASELHSALTERAQDYGTEAVALAAVIVQLVDDLEHRRRPWQSQHQSQHLIAAYHSLQQRLGARADTLIEQVNQLWQQRKRASSAIEGFNASLRPYLRVHKRATQGFLELFRAYYNLRIRRWGRHKNTSAHQSLHNTLDEDWLTLLGFPPSTAMP
jgi:hypothetical protein